MPITVTATHPTISKTQTILFVGGRSSFPDVYLRFIAREFENFDVSIVPTLTTAKARLKAEPYVAVTLIFSTRSIEAEPECLLELSKMVPHFHQVCAYQNVEDINPLLDEIGGTELMAKLSFLPLRTRIDSAINIYSLLVSGERHICGEVIDHLLAANHSPSAGVGTISFDQIDSLTAREKDVLSYLSKGESNKVIAYHLQLSESTIKLHIHHIINKMGVTNRTEAAIAYVAAAGNMRNMPVKE